MMVSPADPHIEGGPDMELELSGRRAHSHQGRHREHLAGAEIDAGTGEHIGKGKPQHQLGKFRVAGHPGWRRPAWVPGDRAGPAARTPVHGDPCASRSCVHPFIPSAV